MISVSTESRYLATLISPLLSLQSVFFFPLFFISSFVLCFLACSELNFNMRTWKDMLVVMFKEVILIITYLYLDAYPLFTSGMYVFMYSARVYINQPTNQ